MKRMNFLDAVHSAPIVYINSIPKDSIADLVENFPDVFQKPEPVIKESLRATGFVSVEFIKGEEFISVADGLYYVRDRSDVKLYDWDKDRIYFRDKINPKNFKFNSNRFLELI